MSILVHVCREVGKNFAIAIPHVREWRLKQPRTAPKYDGSDAALERYAYWPLHGILRMLGDVKNLHIVEIGPGDHLASGLALLAGGAATYTAIDRFPGDYSGQAAKAWYQGVKGSWSRFFPNLPWPDYLDPARFPEAYPNRVRAVPLPVETIDGGILNDKTYPRQYDVVCSLAVGEHVSDITSFASIHTNLLSSSGMGMHRVDFSPHNWDIYPDPFTFLRFPDWLWKLMGSNRGIPNRYRFHEFLDAFAHAGLNTEVIDVKHFSHPVDRSQLASRFREMPVESLSVSEAIFVCRCSQQDT